MIINRINNVSFTRRATAVSTANKNINKGLIGIPKQDTFVSTTKKMDNEKYKQINNDFNKDAITALISNRAESLPMLMDNVFFLIGRYISGKTDRASFIKDYTDETLPLYKRIDSGYKSKEYSEAYRPEISVIKGISGINSQFINKAITAQDFDSQIETALTKYSNTECSRKKNFVI